jgi:hypothetical protein
MQRHKIEFDFHPIPKVSKIRQERGDWYSMQSVSIMQAIQWACNQKFTAARSIPLFCYYSRVESDRLEIPAIVREELKGQDN